MTGPIRRALALAPLLAFAVSAEASTSITQKPTGAVATIDMATDGTNVWPAHMIFDGTTWAIVNAGDSGLTVHVANWLSTLAVTGTFWQATQPVSISAFPALSAGSAIVGKVGIDQTSDGTTNLVAAKQNGTWNVTNISGTVSLPTGASTAAKQPALGTAGTASADVISVQGIASMTPFLANPGTAANWGIVAQGSSTSGQSGHLIEGAVASSNPSYTNGQTSPISIDQANGGVRVSLVAGGSTGGSTAANQTTEITSLGTLHTDLGTINTTLGGAVPAGTAHIGEVSTTPTAGTFVSAACNVAVTSTSCLVSGTYNHVTIQNLGTNTANIACTWGAAPSLTTGVSVLLTPGMSSTWGPQTSGVPVAVALNCLSSSGTINAYVEHN